MAENFHPSASELQAELSEISTAGKQAIRIGFRALSSLDNELRKKLTKTFISEFKQGSAGVDLRHIATISGVDIEIAKASASTINTIIAVVGSDEVTADDFVNAARDIILFPSDVDVAFQVVSVVIEEKESIRKGISRNRLASASIPSLSSFHVSVDVRLQFKDKEINDFAVIGLVHIGKDTGDDVFFQMTKSDAEKVKKRIEILIEQIDQAELTMRRVRN